MARQIIVDFDEQGNPTVETTGFEGGACLAATLELEAALGAKLTDVRTAEFHKRSQTAARANTRARAKS